MKATPQENMRSFVLYELFGEGAFEGRKREGDANQEKGDKRMKNGGKKRRQCRNFEG